MRSPVLLAGCMLLGSGFGAIFVSDFLLSHHHGYDHGFGEGERCNFAGTILGALAGLAVFITHRSAKTWRFSVCDVLLTTTLAATILSITIALLRWVDTYQR